METSMATINQTQIPVLISLSPIQGYGDEILGYICIGTDVSELRKFQRQLEESEFKFRSVLEQTSDGIVLVNQDMKVIYWNQAMEKITGISPNKAEDEYFYNVMWKLFMPEMKEKISLNQVENIFIKAFNGKNIDYHLKLQDLDINTLYDENKTIATFNFFIKESPETLLCIVVRDVTESKNVKDVLESLLKEKEVLLREIHHRVKNNMQIVSSLLNLQSLSVEDENTHKLFKESQNRVKSMSMIHENLYQSSDLAHIDLEKYIKRLGSELFSSYGVDLDKIKLKTAVENIEMDINLPFHGD
ncbi:MAG: histidine kinase dimerization/phosphoacceptor domain -containing protein [Methanobacteriaceae archaeon]|nr:histidine kinase dimerization/phosphoacceptor domain -containing protein [Methanobacteriaceae archaeon]